MIGAKQLVYRTYRKYISITNEGTERDIVIQWPCGCWLIWPAQFANLPHNDKWYRDNWDFKNCVGKHYCTQHADYSEQLYYGGC